MAEPTDFELVYKLYFSDVFKYVLSLCLDEAIAEEITQETFIKALDNYSKFKGDCKLFVWLCQIAKNSYFTFRTKQKKQTTLFDTDNIALGAYADIDIEKNYLDREMARELHCLLHNLDEPYKEVFSLRVFGELPFPQIGALFGKTDSWARLVFYRAKRRIQEDLK